MVDVIESATFKRWIRGLRDRVAVALCGGDKGSQQRDLERAARLAKDWTQT